MAHSARQQIVEALLVLLKTIRQSNDYETNLDITEWRPTDWQVSELPGCDIRDPDENIEVKGQYHYKTISIEAEVKVQDTSAPEVVRNVIADIEKALGTDPTLGGLAYSITPVENESIDFDKKDKSFGGALIKFQISYRTKAFKPYAVV